MSGRETSKRKHKPGSVSEVNKAGEEATSAGSRSAGSGCVCEDIRVYVGFVLQLGLGADMEEPGGVVVASERYGSAESWKYWAQDGAMERRREGGEGRSTGNSVVSVFKSVFLPQGYPESVSDDYLQYQFWDTVQAFSSSLSGTLATQASLKGVGVGNQEATVAAATVTWLLRDGTGMLGRILFAWQKGSKLDSEAKKWRLFADGLNDLAMFMEILAPHFPAFFTLILCTAGVFKSIVGVAGGATRAALTVHQARRDNMADISAKDGSQETLVNLAGLLVSLILIPLVTDNPALTVGLFFLFTILHLFANYKAVRSVVMETFNEARLSIVLQQHLRDGGVLSPAEANRREPVLLDFGKSVPIKLGVRLQEVVQSSMKSDWTDQQMIVATYTIKSQCTGWNLRLVIRSKLYELLPVIKNQK
ncbi:RUS family member 1 isoform X3 [Salarias fasciatus]|uniref:RUS family member 1 isoform X3 n=1 Tax=Salarias fasciatus TaxID=181472 RepID=UPI0011770A8D|nr:RUS1 family protein C16orf58 homolog isoform X3 [Salarias fasciatus]